MRRKSSLSVVAAAYELRDLTHKGAAHKDQQFNYNLIYPALHKENVQFTGSAYNPLESQLATITWDITTALDATNATAPTATITYNHTCYPAHQIKVNGAVVYLYTPPDNSPEQLLNCLLLHNTMVTGTTTAVSVPIR